jgi:AMMECR1 domain-containing protein
MVGEALAAIRFHHINKDEITSEEVSAALLDGPKPKPVPKPEPEPIPDKDIPW